MKTESKYKLAPLVFWCVLGLSIIFTWSLSSYWRTPGEPIGWWYCPFQDEIFGPIWESIDNYIFFSFNGSLGTEKNSWNLMWAIMNYRAFDLFATVFMFGIIIMYAREAEDKDEVMRRIAIMLGAIAYVVISSQILKLFMGSVNRDSGTRLFKHQAILLTDLYPNINCKVKSSSSFPGDHAIILFGFTVAMFKYAKYKYGWASLVVAVFFSLPRLVGGAHWFTDVAVGAGSITMITMSVFFYTPLHLKFEHWSNKIVPKIPFANKIVGVLNKNDKKTV